MILWTIQPEEVLSILEQDNRFVCDPQLSEYAQDFKEPYKWMVEQMDTRGILHPEGLQLPLWAWHTRYGKHKKPDLREAAYEMSGTPCVCIEFEIPDEQVLLSDYDNWHAVLNKWWIDDSETEEEWDKNREWFDNQDAKVRDRLMVESWQKIFDVSPKKTDWISNGMFVQATFWELKKDMIRKVQRFKAR